MRPLSPTEAISPAIDRTRELLTRPFVWTRFLKLTALAFFAEIGSSFSAGFPGRLSRLPIHNPAVVAALAAFVAVLAMVSFAVFLVLLYVGSRLQFVLLEIVATRQTVVAPLWQKYGPHTWRWIGLKLLFFVAAGLIAAPLLILFAVLIGRHHPGATAPLRLSHLSPQVAAFLAVAMVGVLLAAAVYLLLRDFALPILALEHVGVFATLSRLFSLVSASPGEIAVYLLLRLLLAFAFGIGAEFAAFVILLVSALPFAVVGGVMWFALHNSGPAAVAVLSAAAVIGAVLLLVWGAILFVALLGAVSIFGQAYALYFLGGRYPLLGQVLDPLPPLYPAPDSPATGSGWPPPAEGSLPA